MLVYDRDARSAVFDENYRGFWNEIYEQLDQFVADEYNVQKQFTERTPMVIFKSTKFNFVIDMPKLFLILKTAEKDGIDYRDNNLNTFLDVMDKNYELNSELYGISSKGIGVHNFEFDFQKINIFLSDNKPTTFDAPVAENYINFHSSLPPTSMDFEALLESEPGFYKNQ
ncbi:hypothetical protein SCLARK_001160 [Spiroplasma clarkii]|uniref:hypothetical protein n=1 Tax=Spiroplasma clarkii TaxID=2139 RepID=UPI000B555846|nr:hypothetical protein [Spiroplasma clarkii]ARU91719.1 hypothetical protein SCLARK_001160 [Spiroplasma clarkii]